MTIAAGVTAVGSWLQDIARRSADCVQFPDCFGARAQKASADGFLDQRQRLLCLAALRFGYLCTNLRRCRFVFGGVDAQFGLRQGSLVILALATAFPHHLPTHAPRGIYP